MWSLAGFQLSPRGQNFHDVTMAELTTGVCGSLELFSVDVSGQPLRRARFDRSSSTKCVDSRSTPQRIIKPALTASTVCVLSLPVE